MSRKIRASRAAFARRGWMAAGVVALAGAAALAQPGPATPATFVDLGNIGIGQTVASTDQTLASGLYVWFRFNLTTDIRADSSWLDIDSLGPNIIQNNEMALYDNRKNKLAEDNDSGGSGTAGNNFAAAMSIGSGSGQRMSLDPAGGCFSDGFGGYHNVDNRSYPVDNLPAGVYWVCVAAFDTVFPDPNNNWDTTTSSTTSGLVRLKLTTGRKPDTYWNKRHHGDAGDTIGTAQVPLGRGPLETIITGIVTGFKDMFKVHIPDPANFEVTGECSSFDGGGGGSLPLRLYVFRPDGTGVAAINRTVDAPTTLRLPLGTPPGDYYLAVSTNCAGTNTMAGVAYSTGGFMWDFAPAANQNVVIAPNGPGAAGTLAYWGRQSDCRENLWGVKLALRGAFYPQSPGACVADVDDGSGTNTPDGGVTIEDLLYFLQRFEAGC